VDWQVIFSKIESRLVTRIQAVVRALHFQSPVYCLMINYYSSTVLGDVVPTLRLPTVSLRDRVLATKGSEAPYYLWSPQELPNCPEVISAALDDDELLALVRAHPNFVSRKMARNVALRLNEVDWSRIARVAEDFVVIAADATQAFGDTFGDIKASIGDERLDRLRSSGWMGTSSWYQL
jgi:hypothetical protein